MQQLRHENNANPRGLTILARSLFRQMRDQGYSTEQIIGLSSELLDLVNNDLRASGEAPTLAAAE